MDLALKATVPNQGAQRIQSQTIFSQADAPELRALRSGLI
jgi:hypothetical protein